VAQAAELRCDAGNCFTRYQGTAAGQNACGRRALPLHNRKKQRDRYFLQISRAVQRFCQHDRFCREHGCHPLPGRDGAGGLCGAGLHALGRRGGNACR